MGVLGQNMHFQNESNFFRLFLLLQISQCLFSHKKSSPFVLQSFGCLYISLQKNQISVEHQWRNIFQSWPLQTIFLQLSHSAMSYFSCTNSATPDWLQHQTECSIVIKVFIIFHFQFFVLLILTWFENSKLISHLNNPLPKHNQG